MIAFADTSYSGQFRTPKDVQEYFAEQRADYSAAKQSRFKRRRKGLAPGGSHADYHIRSESDYFRMMEIARDMARNDYIVGQGIRRVVANIVQDGFRLEPQTPDATLNNELEVMWNEWACDPDAVSITGQECWHDFETLTLETMLIDGDVFHLPTDIGAIEAVEAHRCRTPRTKRNIVHGVTLDQLRRPQSYMFTREDVSITASSSSLAVNAMREIAARDADGIKQVWHIYNKRRFSQSRGVTVLAPLVDPAGMLDDIQFARLVQQQVVSAWVILRQKMVPTIGGEGGRCATTTGTSETDSSGFDRLLTNVQPGTEIIARDGESVTGFAPNVPNPSFFDHVGLILGIIAVNLDMPVAMLMLDPSNTNFSGWRGAVDQARMRFKQMQRWYASQIHTPTYRWKLRNWIDQGLISSEIAETLGKQLFAHCWHPPRWPYIQPLEDASADLLRDRNALTSKRRLHAASGASWTDLSTEIVDDNALAIEKAIVAAEALNTKYPKNETPVTWRELLSLPTPDGVNVSLQPMQQTAAPSAPARPPDVR